VTLKNPRIEAYQKAYRDAHKEKMRAYSKAYREANREEIRSQRKRFRDANGLRLAARYRELIPPGSSRRSWIAMKQRCLNPNYHQFKDYGGRGITICERWLSSFSNFHQDMGDRPAGLTLDRIDNDGNYEPGNCKWSTRSEQKRNSRSRAGHKRGPYKKRAA
jgi:hypothetical protein